MNTNNSWFQVAISIVVFLGIMTACSTTSTDAEGSGTTNTNEQAEGVDSPADTDYLSDGVVLAPFMWAEGGYSETQYFPSTIVTEASDDTGGEYEVQCVRGNSDVADGEQMWSEDIILDSHPATEEDLDVGMVVLMGSSNSTPAATSHLATTHWNRVIVASLDELYRGTVTVDYVWTPGESDEMDRQYETAVANLRIIDEPVPEL